jgi:hypothetical protein
MSQSLLITSIVLAFLVLFPLFWWLVTRFLKKASGMDRGTGIEALGPLVADCGNGSARINGINHNHTLRLTHHEGGYVFATSPLMGGGQLVVRHDEISSVETNKVFWLFNRVVIKTTFDSTITLYGRLARAFAQAAHQGVNK